VKDSFFCARNFSAMGVKEGCLFHIFCKVTNLIAFGRTKIDITAGDVIKGDEFVDLSVSKTGKGMCGILSRYANPTLIGKSSINYYLFRSGRGYTLMG